MTPANRQLIGQLGELVEALDRRTPALWQAGEPAIARDAAALRTAAEARIVALKAGSSMTVRVTPVQAAVLSPTCPLCHTHDLTVTPESLSAGATWACTTCGQQWSAARLETAAAYARFAAAR